MSLIEFKNLTVSQNNKIVLNEISTSFPNKGIYTIIGPSKSGKTFFLKSINRLLDLEEGIKITGTIDFQQKDIYQKFNDFKWLRKEIGMIFHKPMPFPKDIYENIAISLRIHFPKSSFPEQIKTILEELNLWEMLQSKLNYNANTFPIEIQQWIVLARLLATRPTTILMDNPTIMMDPVATARFESWMLSAKERYLFIVVTSDIKQAARISDQIIFLKSGELIEKSETETFLSTPRHALTEHYISESHFI